MQCPSMAVFCSSQVSCSLGMLLRYCLSHLETVPVAPNITGITSAFTFHEYGIFYCLYVLDHYYVIIKLVFYGRKYINIITGGLK